jgi:hypothetical protein
VVTGARQKPRRSIRLLIRAFERAKWVHKGELTRSMPTPRGRAAPQPLREE